MMVKGNSGSDPRQKKGGKIWCDHCSKFGHTKDVCWKLHRRPFNWKTHPQRETKGLMVAGEEKEYNDRVLFNEDIKDQLELLQRMIANQRQGSEGTVSTRVMAHTNDFPMSTPKNPNTWIVDSGASDHMTGFGVQEEDWLC